MPVTETASQEDLSDNPQGWAQRLKMELEAANKAVKTWHDTAYKIFDEFLDAGRGTSGHASNDDVKWNLFWSDTTTKESILFGKTPRTDVSRTFGDSKDQVGRVAGEITERLLNNDIEKPDGDFSFALWCCLKDFMLPGLGWLKMRYEAKLKKKPGKPARIEKDPETGEEKELAPEVPDTEVKEHEDVETDHIHWNDVRWAACRTWKELRLVMFRAQMSKEQLVARFAEPLGRMRLGAEGRGEEDEDAGDEGDEAEAIAVGRQMIMGGEVPLNSKKGENEKDPVRKNDPWARADVWECWEKGEGGRRRVYWYVEGMSYTLDMQEDPLQLTGFWPFPRPMIDNWTTKEFMPRPTYVIVQDLYREINDLSSRLNALQKSLKVRGVYDQSNQDLGRLMKEAGDGDLIGVANWAMFGEKGGLAGAVQFFPLQEVAETILKLRDVRKESIDALREISGMGDVIRGSRTENGTPGEANLEAKFGSVRMQAVQNEFARFASEAQQIRAEIIAKHFDPQTIKDRSNAAYMPDADQPGLIDQAIQLIKGNFGDYRVTVKPESVALDDFAAMKSEAVELLEAVGTFFQKVAPLAQQAPQAMPEVFEMFTWMVSRIKGGKEIEGVVTRMAQKLAQAGMQAQQAQQQQGDDGKVAAKMAEIQAKHAADLQRIQAETAADKERNASESQQHMQEEQAAHELSMREAEYREQLKLKTAIEIQRAKPPPVVRPAPTGGPRR